MGGCGVIWELRRLAFFVVGSSQARALPRLNSRVDPGIRAFNRRGRWGAVSPKEQMLRRDLMPDFHMDRRHALDA